MRPSLVVEGVASGSALHLDPVSIGVAALAFAAVGLAALLVFARSAEAHRLRGVARKIRELLGGNPSVSFLPPERGSLLDLSHALEGWRQSWMEQVDALDRERLLQSEVFDSLREGVLAVSSSHSVMLANSQFRALFGLSESAVGRPLVQVLRHSAVLAAFDRAIAGEEVSEAISVEISSGVRHIEMLVLPLPDPSEFAAVALFLDVTRLKRLERVRREFIADFSHEVRTPLAGLRTACETLETSRVTPAQEEKLWKVVSRQLRRLERLVEDLSELDRIESGDLILQREPTELRRLLRDLREDFSESMSNRQITLAVEGDESVASVDPAKVQQIFSNLLENAIKFSRPSGRVRLHIEDTPSHSVVRVIDDGEGIAPEEQERIFNRFYRIDKSRSQELPGTGLGLAITKHLVLRHGGTIRVFSEPGRGATFEVRLPKGSAERSDLQLPFSPPEAETEEGADPEFLPRGNVKLKGWPS